MYHVVCIIVPITPSKHTLGVRVTTDFPMQVRSKGPRLVSAAEVWRTLSVSAAADALARGFASRSSEDLNAIPRSVIPLPGSRAGENQLLLMPGYGAEGAGVKFVSIVPSNASRNLPLIQGMYVLLTPDGLTPELLIDGSALTALRTSSVSALASRYLARPDSRRLVVFGAGAQATAHVEAMRTVLPIDHVTIVASSPTSLRGRKLAAALTESGLDAVLGHPDAVRNADVICCCTTSKTPVFRADDLPGGAHVNAVGAYRLDMAELPGEVLRESLLTVESIEATLDEAGDIVAAIDAGLLDRESFAHELTAVLNGIVRRTDDAEVTIFKSVGLSFEDLIVARALADALN